MNARNVIIFLCGIGAGFLGGILASKNYFEKISNDRADKEIEEMREFFKKKTENYLVSEEGVVEDPCDGELISNTGRENGKLDNDERNKIKNEYRIKRAGYISDSKGDDVTPYHKMYKKNIPNDRAEEEGPEEDNVEDETLEDRANRLHEKNRNRKPKIISVDELGDLEAYIEEKTLFYYTYDDVLTDEDDNEIDNPGYLVGDCLEKYDFANNDENVIYVLNYSIDTCYEIQKVRGSWSTEG